MATVQTETFERLKTAEKQQSGNVETATIGGVTVAEDTVTLSLQFPWSTADERVSYDLTDDRDVCRLADIARSLGYQFDQVPALEGERLPVRYTERGWLPEPEREAEVEKRENRTWSVPNPIAAAAQRLRSASTTQLIVGVILLKKLLIVGVVVSLVL
jgi:hypothetical protein